VSVLHPEQGLPIAVAGIESLASTAAMPSPKFH
jgi:hypothetical protein